MNDACPVIVMAKAPVAGFAKTRLAPALGEAGAARLAERLLCLAVEHAVAARIGPVEICCAPDTTHPAFATLAETHAVALTRQGDGDLGARMARALERRLSGQTRALLIGTDAPALDAAALRQACAALADHDAVFAPTFDGGYALIGLRRPVPRLFDEIAWSTAQVMQRTRERLTELGLRWSELAPLADIDEAADLCHLSADWPEARPSR